MPKDLFHLCGVVFEGCVLVSY